MAEARKNFDFIGKRKLFLIIAACILVAGVIANLFLGTELDINFKGGAIFTYSFSAEVDRDAAAAIAAEHLGDDVNVAFSRDVSGENLQATFTLVKVPSTLLTYSVSGSKPDVEALTASAKEIFQCETTVSYDADQTTLTVDPSAVVTDAMVEEFTQSLSSTEEGAPSYTLQSSNTVSELADAMLDDLVAKFGTAFTFAYTPAEKDGLNEEDATKAVEDALTATLNEAAGAAAADADVTVAVDADAKTVTVRPASGNRAFTEADAKTITEALQTAFPKAGVSLKSSVYNAVTLVTSNSVKATVGKGFFIKCLFAMVLGGIFLTLYIGIRFRRIGGVSAGLFATFALIHDILISYFVYVVFRIPLDDNFIAVVLTILGYSINGTIVVYDRIRENERRFGTTLSLSQIVNRSVNETVNRNIFTSLSTFIAIVAIAVVAKINGLDSIISFAFPMAVGIVAGFYSSVLLSSPWWAWWRTRRLEKAAARKK